MKKIFINKLVKKNFNANQFLKLQKFLSSKGIIIKKKTTFKFEFEKLISPLVTAKLLPEYLKNNYLEGQAYELVKEIHQIDDIWEIKKLIW